MARNDGCRLRGGPLGSTLSWVIRLEVTPRSEQSRDPSRVGVKA